MALSARNDRFRLNLSFAQLSFGLVQRGPPRLKQSRLVGKNAGNVCGIAGVVSQFPAKRNLLRAPDFSAQTIHARE